jgi:hypothetical protein
MKFNNVSMIFITSVFIYFHSFGQDLNEKADHITSNNDSSNFHYENQLIPIGLIANGLGIEFTDIKQDMQDWFPRTNTNADDFLQYVPIAELYVSDLIKMEHRNNVFNQTKYLIISELATGIITQALKKITGTKRPNGGLYAFPSGHTSQAFTGATVLYNETKDDNLPLAYSGYLFSTATALLRVTNNKHWVSDVLVGAGIAMLITNFVYYIEPLKNWDPFKLNGKAKIIPDLNIDSDKYFVSVKILLN